MIEEKQKEFIPLYFDVLFKKIFGDPNDLKPLRYLLKVVLNIEPIEIKILSPEVIGEKYKTKRTYLDLLVKLDDGTKISIEVNTNPKSYVIDRNLFFLFKTMGNDLKTNEEYSGLHKHIQINFNVHIPQKKPVMNYKLIDIETKEVLTEKLEIINIDITYFANTWYNKNTDEFSKLMGLIGTKEEENLRYFQKETGIMKNIIDKANKFREDEEVVEVYDYEKMRDDREKMAYKEGIETGYDRGVKEGIEITVQNLLKLNLDIDTISKATGLSKEQIEELKN